MELELEEENTTPLQDDRVLDDIKAGYKNVMNMRVTPDTKDEFDIKLESLLSHMTAYYKQIMQHYIILSTEVDRLKKTPIIKEQLESSRGAIPIELFKKVEQSNNLLNQLVQHLSTGYKVTKHAWQMYAAAYGVNQAMSVQSEALKKFSEEQRKWYELVKEVMKTNNDSLKDVMLDFKKQISENNSATREYTKEQSKITVEVALALVEGKRQKENAARQHLPSIETPLNDFPQQSKPEPQPKKELPDFLKGRIPEVKKNDL